MQLQCHFVGDLQEEKEQICEEHMALYDQVWGENAGNACQVIQGT